MQGRNKLEIHWFDSPLNFNLKKQKKKTQGIPPFLDILNFFGDDKTRASIEAWT